MNILLPNRNFRPSIQRERGSALLIVIVLLGLMITLLIGNNLVLRNLHRQIQLVEKKQLRQSGVVEKRAVTQPNNQ